jgi:ABC-type transport system involved in cytochrome bd biosynthesis fused ATPase/permease subunit
MKSRKKATLIAIENRNALYNKTIHHNIELANKNTELSQTINILRNNLKNAEKVINRKRWCQFWRWFE